MADDRFDRGAGILERLMGFRASKEQLGDDFGRMTVEHLFGDVWSRPGLALRDRSLITVAALTVLGREQELKMHLRGALRVGISRDEIHELLLHLAHYGGWPIAVGGMRAATEVFAEADAAKK